MWDEKGRYYSVYLGHPDERKAGTPLKLYPFMFVWGVFFAALIYWLFTLIFVPEPRKSKPSEKKFTTIDKSGNLTQPEPLPSWYDDCMKKYQQALAKDPDTKFDIESEIDGGELLVSVVVPAFNEEKRMIGMLEEAVEFLQKTYPAKTGKSISTISETNTATEDAVANGELRKRQIGSNATTANGHVSKNSLSDTNLSGWEILIIDDGSKDKTLEVAQEFSRRHILPPNPRRDSGPWSHRSEKAVRIPAGSIRIVSLEKNRGKGGAVSHGLRHVRGKYVVFADADGASDIKDLSKLISKSNEIADSKGCAMVVGSRAHLVGSEAVVKRSKLRNFLMHCFHLTIKYMTPSKTASIKDTQCGFKLLTRPTLPWIVPHLHIDSWIFDVEMLMLAEWSDIPVREVAVGWKEVSGSKLNVVTDSIGMAYGLAMLRLCWAVGIYRR